MAKKQKPFQWLWATSCNGSQFLPGRRERGGGNKKKWVTNSFEMYIKITERKFRKWLHA